MRDLSGGDWDKASETACFVFTIANSRLQCNGGVKSLQIMYFLNADRNWEKVNSVFKRKSRKLLVGGEILYKENTVARSNFEMLFRKMTVCKHFHRSKISK